MTTSVFENLIDRNNTSCRKWDDREEVFGTKDVLPFWIADMDFASPPAVIDAVRAQADRGVYGYHSMSASFYQSILQWLRRRHNWVVERNALLTAPGVVPSINLAILALTQPEDRILIQSPVYPPFFHCIRQNRRQLVDNPLVSQNGHYQIDFEDLEKKLSSNVKMFILCSPHNPVGRVWTKNELLQIGELCLKYNVILLADEIHNDLVFQGHVHTPLASISPELNQNTVTCIAPSKTFNIAGLSTSFIVVADPEKRTKISQVQNSLSIGGVNMFGVTATEAAYTSGDAWLDELLLYLEQNAEFIVKYVSEQIPGVQVFKPEGTYLAWLDFRQLFPDSNLLQSFLIQKARVGLNNGATFGQEGNGFARLNFGCPRSQLQTGLEQIKQALKKHL